MYPLLFYLAFVDQSPQPPDPYPDLPPASDARRFPPSDECHAQVERASDHIAWLARMAPAWPEWRDRWEAWTEQAERDRMLWGVLRDAMYADGGGLGRHECRERLARYRWWVGEKRFEAGWTPPVLPADLHPKPAAEKVPVVPRVDAAGVNGGGR